MPTPTVVNAAALPPGFDYRPGFVSPALADRLFVALLAEIPWSQHRVRLFGRELPAPRLSSWHGDPEAVYAYSGRRHLPNPWTAGLLQLRQRLQEQLGATFNGVLANYYRDGRDRMGWHADDEPELGPRPMIASLSLGAVRPFDLKPRAGGPRLRLLLESGSLLLMYGDSQRQWLHALPRSARVAGPRLNLTFRNIVAVDAAANLAAKPELAHRRYSRPAQHGR